MQKVVNHARCMVLRDQDSIEQLKHNLKHSRRVLILGNGGIALELIHALSGFEVYRSVNKAASAQKDCLSSLLGQLYGTIYTHQQRAANQSNMCLIIDHVSYKSNIADGTSSSFNISQILEVHLNDDKTLCPKV